MSSEFNENNYSSKMDKTILSLRKDISTLRTGRANTSMLDTIKVDVYGQLMPIEQLGTISVPEARLISIQVWDKTNTPLIDSAIQKSELGINPGLMSISNKIDIIYDFTKTKNFQHSKNE